MKTVILTVIVYTIILVGLMAITPAPEGRYYDCSMAEFHPDFPREVKEACRKIRIKTPITSGLTT